MTVCWSSFVPSQVVVAQCTGRTKQTRGHELLAHMSLDRNTVLFLALCCLLGWLAPELYKRLPSGMAALVSLALFLGLLALLNYAKSRNR